MAKRIVAVDLDGTLAHYDGWKGAHHIGKPVQAVVDAVNAVRKSGGEVFIYTARLTGSDEEVKTALNYIEQWCIINEIVVDGYTSVKEKFFTEFWDDRAIRVVRNKGIFISEYNGTPIEIMHNTGIKMKELNNAFAGLEPTTIGPAFTPAEEPRTPTSALDIQEGGNHYKKYKIQPIEFCFANNIPVLEANAQKYILRHADKNGMEDLRKARHYLELMAEMYYGEKL